MAVTLQRIPRPELDVLASFGVPERLANSVAAGALPPAFIAQRAMRQQDAGMPELWCSTFYIVRNGDGVVVGSCGFKDAPTCGQIEIGYGVAPTCRNLGIATEAVRELCRLAFANAEIRAVLAQVSAANVSSSRVVEKLAFEKGETKVDLNGESLVQWVSRRGHDVGVTAPTENDAAPCSAVRAAARPSR